MNENDAYIFDVELPVERKLGPGKTWVAGWFLSKTGALFRDLRLRLDDRVFSGIFGQPRPEIEQRHRGYVGLPHAGFSFLVEPHFGARLLRLEILDHGGNWVEIWRTKIKVTAGRLSGRKPALDPKQVADVIGSLLKARRVSPLANLLLLARQLALAAATEPLDVHPSPPFWGKLEEPSNIGHSQFGKVPVTGWIIHSEKRITRLTASADILIENDLVHRQPREDAIRLFPQHPQAAKSQFYGLVELSEDVPNPAAIKIHAELEDGTKHLVFHQRFRQLSCNHKEQAFPAFSYQTFLEVIRILRAACRAEHISTGQPLQFWPAVQEAYREFRQKAPRSLHHLAAEEGGDAYQLWLHHNQLAPALLSLMRQSAETLAPQGPRLAIVGDLRTASTTHLRELIQSLRAQIYAQWELWLVLPKKSALSLTWIAQRAAHKDNRIHVIKAPEDASYATGLNVAVHQSIASHFALIPASGKLAPDALLHAAEAVQNNPALTLLYSDEDRMEDDGRRHTPWMKGDWNPELAISGLFPGNLCLISKKAFVEAGSFRPESDRVPFYDLQLRLGDRLTPAQVKHLPWVCYHARASVSLNIDPSDRSIEQARKALNETFDRRQWQAEAFFPPSAHHRHRLFHQARWSRRILAQNPVTVVIPTRDRLHLLEECVELLGETIDWRYVKLIIVDDHSRDTDVLRYLDTIQQRTDINCRVIRPADRAAPFNYSHLMNLALPYIDTPLILHLNNDVNALEPGWLEDMVGWITRPDVGVVGAKLIYPDRTLNHVGVIIGPHGGLADTPFVRKPEADVPEIDWHATTRDVSAVIGGCMLTRTDLYKKLGGFEEKQFGVAYNDVDYCLQVLRSGYRVVQSPQAKLMHWGSATRGVTYDEAEHVAFIQKYGDFKDSHVSAALHLVNGSLVPSPTHYAHTARAGRVRILLITHNLNLEGAPLFLLEYASWLVRNAGFSIEVLSAEEGPLRKNYEELGAKITLMDRHRIYSAETKLEFYERIAELRQKLDLSQIDLIVANTLMSFWGVHLARQAKKPSLLYIHESTSIYRFFSKALRLSLHSLVEEAFHDATRALFLCRATEAYYKDYDIHGNYRIVPSWIQVGTINAFKAAHSREALRRKYGYSSDDVIITNIGTVCERKGQHTFIRAVKHLQGLLKDGRNYRFVMVGGRQGIYLDLLQADIRDLNLPNLEIIHETRDVYDFFGLADLFVCSSFEESFPRVVLEAMAFRVPIVSTDVHGIPDIVKNRAEAWLVRPGDHLAMAKTIKTCLDKERSGKSFTATAFSKVVRYYDYDRVMPFHRDLAREACLDHTFIASSAL